MKAEHVQQIKACRPFGDGRNSPYPISPITANADAVQERPGRSDEKGLRGFAATARQASP
jgi:hypothetical protein